MHALFLACFGIVVVQAATYISEGWYTIRNAAAGTVLDLYNSVTDRGTTIQGYQALGGINQLVSPAFPQPYDLPGFRLCFSGGSRGLPPGRTAF